jgi:hypothetical protein
MTSKSQEVEDLQPLDIFEEFATDENLEVDGVWVPRGSGSFLIAREGNIEATKFYLDLFDQNRLLLESSQKDLVEQKNKEINIKTMAKTILKDWKNLSYQGQPLPYSEENAAMLLKHRDFRLWVSQQSMNVALYKHKQEAIEEKN